MRDLYFASFFLGRQGDPSPGIEKVLGEVSDWVFNHSRRPGPEPENWLNDNSGETSYMDAKRRPVEVEYVRFESDNKRAVAVRYRHHDESPPSGTDLREVRIWQTDCVIHSDTDGDSLPFLRFSSRLSAGYMDGLIRPYDLQPSAPGIVGKVIRKFGAHDSRYNILPKHFEIGEEGIDLACELLFDEKRELPIIFISRRDDPPPYDVGVLSHKLTGIAHVLMAANRDVSMRLSDRLAQRGVSSFLNTFDGGTRIYWPKLSADDSPGKHPLWIFRRAEELRKKELSRCRGSPRAPSYELSNQVLARVSEASRVRRIQGIVNWRDVEREIARHSLALMESELRNQQEKQEDIEQGLGIKSIDDFREWRNSFDEISVKNSELEEEIGHAGQNLQKSEDEKERYRNLYSLALNLLGDARGFNSPFDETAVSGINDVIYGVKRLHGNRIVILERAVRHSAHHFEKAESLYAAFVWLATVFYEARSGEGSGGMDLKKLQKSCKQMCGFNYSANSSETTMGEHPSDYFTEYKGKGISFESHIGYGSAHNPRHTIRVAFHYHKKEKKIIVGYIGQHQKTRQS